MFGQCGTSGEGSLLRSVQVGDGHVEMSRDVLLSWLARPHGPDILPFVLDIDRKMTRQVCGGSQLGPPGLRWIVRPGVLNSGDRPSEQALVEARQFTRICSTDRHTRNQILVHWRASTS